jgi:hypothetical protein
MPANACVLDSDCPVSDTFCSSDKPITVCRCLGGVDGCDELSTCQALPVAAPPAPTAPVLSPCESCSQCIKGLQGFVTDVSRDAATAAAAFLVRCLTSFRPGDVLACRDISSAIAYSLDGNLAKRPAALCARLGNCSAEVLSTSTSCSITMPNLPVGRPDTCSVEGITGGTTLTLAADSGALAA